MAQRGPTRTPKLRFPADPTKMSQCFDSDFNAKTEIQKFAESWEKSFNSGIERHAVKLKMQYDKIKDLRIEQAETKAELKEESFVTGKFENNPEQVLRLLMRRGNTGERNAIKKAKSDKKSAIKKIKADIEEKKGKLSSEIQAFKQDHLDKLQARVEALHKRREELFGECKGKVEERREEERYRE